ncbi:MULTISPECIES: family 20 glycosylhydrolase [unclassified Sphingomonas]|uniref:family 20 glycosylhydrolase n=1 Tax=unclassified Sphingomonas TaxID=196159 RepID=UPI0006F48267|nr:MULTISPECIES: family 20 glycosylhydrolase [unclassified Sphingomonas]KQM99903.1 hypothetical protein ASE77_02935 [Sphingomonas sp. Leaf226]MDY0965651.1 family 20 glycosylhydrolase [Sphingomonas sp. CFBP9021]
MLKAGAAALCTAAATPVFGVAAGAPVGGGARPPRDQRRFVSPAVEQEIVRVKARIADPALRHLFETCYPNTLDTTVRLGIVDGKPDGFVITGDIEAMWLRDSSAQMQTYVHLCRRDPELRRLFHGVIQRQARCILIDSYANAFMADPQSKSNLGAIDDLTEMRAGVAERKWELDSLCYAAARAVTIVPEIDLPGHAQAAVAAYPQIGVTGDRPPVSGDWGINPYLFNVDDRSITFVKQVLDEVMAIFPSTYIHIGGDEALKEQWQASAAVQAKMRTLGIADEKGLQSWFVGQLGAHLAKRGRRLIGWDEILEGGLPPTASVMSWRGEAGAIEAANMGHDVVLSPGPVLYLDNLQSGRDDEPPGRMAVQTLADVYAYDPLPAGIAAAKAHHVLGPQANLWAEYMVTPAQREHALFPHIAALAEMAWSPRAARDWPGFLARLDPQLNRYQRQGIAAADSAFAVDYTVVGGVGPAVRGKTVTIGMANQADYGTIRYTTDGAAPSSTSRAYARPLSVAPDTVVRAVTFAPDGRALAAVRSFDTAPAALLTRASASLETCAGAGIRLRLPLTPDATGGGPAYSMNIYDGCWLYRAAPLGQIRGITVSLGRLPRNFALRQPQRQMVAWRYNPTHFGTLMVHARTCDGPALAMVPLPDPATTPNQFILTAPLAGGTTDTDLCLIVAPPVGGPLYGVDTVRFTLKDIR